MYQGERALAKDNSLLHTCTFDLSSTAACATKEKGKLQINITFDVDVDCNWMTITAECVHSGKKESTTIQLPRVSDAHIEAAILDAERHAAEDQHVVAIVARNSMFHSLSRVIIVCVQSWNCISIQCVKRCNRRLRKRS